MVTTVSQGRRNRISFRLGKVLQATGRVEFQPGVVLHRGWGCCPQSSLYCPPSVPPCLYGLIVFSSIHQRRHAISVLWQPCHSFPNCVHTSMRSGEHVRHRIPSVSTYSYCDFFWQSDEAKTSVILVSLRDNLLYIRKLNSSWSYMLSCVYVCMRGEVSKVNGKTLGLTSPLTPSVQTDLPLNTEPLLIEITSVLKT